MKWRHRRLGFLTVCAEGIICWQEVTWINNVLECRGHWLTDLGACDNVIRSSIIHPATSATFIIWLWWLLQHQLVILYHKTKSCVVKITHNRLNLRNSHIILTIILDVLKLSTLFTLFLNRHECFLSSLSSKSLNLYRKKRSRIGEGLNYRKSYVDLANWTHL